MYLLMAEKANRLLQKYRIREFPVPVEMIEHIIYSEGIGIQITKYLKRALFCDNVIYIGQALENKRQREYLVHEAAHMYHCGNTAILDPIIVDKNEGQARAFAAYFLMPIGVFEAHLARGESDYEIIEAFGVKGELVQHRKEVSMALLYSGNYERLKCNFFSHDTRTGVL
jgi:Zn-dependent peptidase ImmA (M78 family)